MSVDPSRHAPSDHLGLRQRVDRTLEGFLLKVRSEMAANGPDALLPIDEVIRLIAAGGKRLRPAFCYWGYRAAGAPEGPAIVRAASALELLHTMALIHDDLMDDASDRRGVPASAIHLAGQVRGRGGGEPDRAGRSLAILAGDLAAVLADRLLLAAGFDPDRLVRALDRYHRMRTDMAMGQCLDVLSAGGTDPALVAALKGGVYTVGGPLSIGATLAGAEPRVHAALAAYGDPLGLAFQLRDDERDGDAAPAPGRVESLAARARAALDVPGLDAEAVGALRSLADLVEAG